MGIQKEIERERIVVRDVKNNEMEQVMKQFRLDVGEASAYFLFKMMNAKAILTDDQSQSSPKVFFSSNVHKMYFDVFFSSLPDTV